MPSLDPKVQCRRSIGLAVLLLSTSLCSPSSAEEILLSDTFSKIVEIPPKSELFCADSNIRIFIDGEEGSSKFLIKMISDTTEVDWFNAYQFDKGLIATSVLNAKFAPRHFPFPSKDDVDRNREFDGKDGIFFSEYFSRPEARQALKESWRRFVLVEKATPTPCRRD